MTWNLGLGTWNFIDGCEFSSQAIKEERVDDLVDVGDGRVVHPAFAARLGVERRFEDRAEDDRRDARPVELLAAFAQHKVEDFVVEGGDFDFAAEEAAVDIGEGGQVGFEIGVALFGRRVEDLEEVDQRAPRARGGELLQVVVELEAAEDLRVLGVEEEDDADAQLVERGELKII